MSGTTLDPTIPLRAGQGVAPPANPLATMGQFMQLRALSNQNALYPGQQQLQQQQITGSDLQNQQAQLNLTRAQNTAINAYLAPAVSKGANATLDDYTSALARAQAAGYDTTRAIADLHSAGPDGAALSTWGRTRLGAGLSPAEAVSASTPSPAMVNNGQSLQPSQVSPALSDTPGAVTPVGGAVQVYPSRDALAGRTTVGFDPKTGAPIAGPLATVTPPNLAGPAALPPLPFANGGRFPDALRNPAVAPAAATGGVVTGAPGPAQTAQLAESGGTSAKAFQDIADQGVQARSQSAILGNMLGDTANFQSGPTNVNGYKTTLMRYAPTIAQGFGLDPKAIAANESFDKLANQIAGAQGAGSDARLAVAQGGNPSSHLSQAGVDLMLRQLQGNADYIQARSKVAASYPNQTDRAGFEANVGSSLDPRAFQFDRMTGPQKADYAKSLSPQDRKKVQSSYNFAVQNGLIGGTNGN